MKILSFEPPLGDLGVTYTSHLHSFMTRWKARGRLSISAS